MKTLADNLQALLIILQALLSIVSIAFRLSSCCGKCGDCSVL